MLYLSYQYKPKGCNTVGEKLNPNARKITSAFCIVIISVTFLLVILRLTVFSGMVPQDSMQDLTPNTNQGAVIPHPQENNGDETTLNYRIRTDIHFKSAREKGNITIINEPENNLYIRVEIIYDISGRSLYLSPFIKPGEKLDSAYLQGEELAPGVYSCTAEVSVYNPEDREKLETYKHEVVITVDSPQ